MADPAPQFALTEADIEALAAGGEFEIDTDPDPNAPLVRLTRTIASQYVERFNRWAEDDEVETEVALRALSDVDRLAATCGDDVLQEALASVPRRRGRVRWPAFLQGWIDRIGAALGPADR